MAAIWLLVQGLPRYERWQAGRNIAQVVAKAAPIQAVVEQWVGQYGQCPELFLADGSRIDRRVRRVYLGRTFPPHCNVPIDLLPPEGRAGLPYPVGVHLILKDGKWLCMPRDRPQPGFIPGCQASAQDVLAP
jgi:hypothetical protein